MNCCFRVPLNQTCRIRQLQRAYRKTSIKRPRRARRLLEQRPSTPDAYLRPAFIRDLAFTGTGTKTPAFIRDCTFNMDQAFIRSFSDRYPGCGSVCCCMQTCCYTTLHAATVRLPFNCTSPQEIPVHISYQITNVL